MKGQTALHSSNSMHWNTPEEVLDLIRKCAPIELDPCSNPHSLVGATTTIAPPKDGLQEDWLRLSNGGLVYVNPPYGRELAPWSKKIAKEASRGTMILSLTPARTDTRWFQDVLYPWAGWMGLWKGRMKFVDGLKGTTRTSAPFPSMFLGFNLGDKSKMFNYHFNSRAICIENP